MDVSYSLKVHVLQNRFHLRSNTSYVNDLPWTTASKILWKWANSPSRILLHTSVVLFSISARQGYKPLSIVLDRTIYKYSVMRASSGLSIRIQS